MVQAKAKQIKAKRAVGRPRGGRRRGSGRCTGRSKATPIESSPSSLAASFSLWPAHATATGGCCWWRVNSRNPMRRDRGASPSGPRVVCVCLYAPGRPAVRLLQSVPASVSVATSSTLLIFFQGRTDRRRRATATATARSTGPDLGRSGSGLGPSVVQHATPRTLRRAVRCCDNNIL